MAKKVKLHGIFAVNKPRGKTCVEVLEMLNKVFRGHAASTRIEMTKRKVVKLGHAGTLDPLARGVLVVGVNDGLKELIKYNKSDKVYEAVGMFGFATNTDDAEGVAIKKAPTEHITRTKLEEILPKFIYKSTQVPPLYSAIRMDGRRLYEYARSGDPLPREIPERPVKILSLTLKDFTSKHNYKEPKEKEPDDNNTEDSNPSESSQDVYRPKFDYESRLHKRKNEPIKESIYPIFKIHVHCGSGTYIRSLIRDIGVALNSAAYMVDLERVQHREFKLGEDTLELEECLDFDKIFDAINNHNRKMRLISLDQSPIIPKREHTN